MAWKELPVSGPDSRAMAWGRTWGSFRVYRHTSAGFNARQHLGLSTQPNGTEGQSSMLQADDKDSFEDLKFLQLLENPLPAPAPPGVYEVHKLLSVAGQILGFSFSPSLPVVKSALPAGTSSGSTGPQLICLNPWLQGARKGKGSVISSIMTLERERTSCGGLRGVGKKDFQK